MKLYKSPNNEIYAYEENGSQDHLIPSDFIALTQSEIDARNTELAASTQAELEKQQALENAKASALAKLTALGLTQDEVKALLG
jgi:hypothetical protein